MNFLFGLLYVAQLETLDWLGAGAGGGVVWWRVMSVVGLVGEGTEEGVGYSRAAARTMAPSSTGSTGSAHATALESVCKLKQ